MPYALGLMLLHFALRFWRRNAACMRWLWACIQAPRGCLDTSLTLRCTQACTLKHALSRQVLCPVHSTRHMHMHCIFWAAESGVHAAALGVHPGTKRMPRYSPARWHARRSGRTVSCTLCPVHSSRHYNFVEFWTVSSRFRQRERRMHAGVHSCTPKIAYTLACILYLAILRARIDSACIHVA